jgi:hypothetical protein
MKRQCPRPRLRATDRWFWVWLLRTWPNWRKAFALGETRDRHWLASARIPPFLVLALQAKAVRSAGNESRTQGFGASDGGSQSPVGRTSHSWGANETGNRNLGTHCLPTNAQASEATLTDVEDFLENHANELILFDFLHRPYRYVSGLVCPSGARSSPPACDSLQRNRASLGSPDRAADG